MKSGNTKSNVAKWSCCFEDISSIKCPASLCWALSLENTDDICHIYIIYVTFYLLYIYIYNSLKHNIILRFQQYASSGQKLNKTVDKCNKPISRLKEIFRGCRYSPIHRVIFPWYLRFAWYFYMYNSFLSISTRNHIFKSRYYGLLDIVQNTILFIRENK